MITSNDLSDTNYMDGRFLHKVCAWVEKFVSSLSVALKVNDAIDGTPVDNREFVQSRGSITSRRGVINLPKIISL